MKVTRRELLAGFALGAGGLWLPSCGGKGSRPDASPVRRPVAPVVPAGEPPTPYGTGPYDKQPEVAGETCSATADNIEGPYHRDGAPWRDDLTSKDMDGTRLTLRGKVTGLDCVTGLDGATLDVWQANHDGHYDNDGTMDLPASEYLLRGKLKVGASGEYTLQTIVPGRYLNGRRYRPSHIHVKVAARGHRALTTQLYFPDDPYNDGDPFFDSSLIMNVKAVASGAREARFDFILPPA